MIVTFIRPDARAREKPCLRCGQSLRKVLDERHCPQCGLSIWLSLNANDALDWSNPPWLWSMSAGAVVLAAAHVIGWLAMLAVLAGWAMVQVNALTGDMRLEMMAPPPHVLAATQPNGQPDPRVVEQWMAEQGLLEPQPPPPSPLIAAGALGGGAALVLAGLGLALLVRHERRYPDLARHIWIGSKVCAAAAALFGVALMAMSLRHLAAEGWPIAAPMTSLWVLATEIALAALIVCQWAWLRRLARRAGHWRLARMCGWLLFLPVLGLLKFTPILGIWVLYLLWPFVQFLPVLYLPFSAVVLIWFALLLRRTSRAAEANWAAETKAG